MSTYVLHLSWLHEPSLTVPHPCIVCIKWVASAMDPWHNIATSHARVFCTPLCIMGVPLSPAFQPVLLPDV